MVDYSLATAYDFLQILYLSGKVASAINSDWDTAWYLWAEVAESQLGKECDIAAGVEQIVKTVRQDARKGTTRGPISNAPTTEQWCFSTLSVTTDAGANGGRAQSDRRCCGC